MKIEIVRWAMTGWASGDWQSSSQVVAVTQEVISVGVVVRETGTSIIVAPHVLSTSSEKSSKYIAGHLEIPNEAIIRRDLLTETP